MVRGIMGMDTSMRMQNTSREDLYIIGRGRITHVLGVAILVVALGLCVTRTYAQEIQPYEYARPGQPTMTIYVWGAVSKPGIWVIEREATLVEVLSLVNVQAGGDMQEGARETRFLRIYRGGGAPQPSGAYGDRDLVYEAPLDEMMTALQLAPGLQDGDVLAVEVETHRSWFTFRNISSLIGTAAALTLLIIRLGEL